MRCGFFFLILTIKNPPHILRSSLNLVLQATQRKGARLLNGDFFFIIFHSLSFPSFHHSTALPPRQNRRPIRGEDGARKENVSITKKRGVGTPSPFGSVEPCPRRGRGTSMLRWRGLEWTMNRRHGKSRSFSGRSKSTRTSLQNRASWR